MAQYIDKSALVAEINRVLNSYGPTEITSGRYALINLRSFLDTLEVKEVAWKPSDEQMDALANALSLAKSCGEESAFDLRKLYEQLKKLKED